MLPTLVEKQPLDPSLINGVDIRATTAASDTTATLEYTGGIAGFDDVVGYFVRGADGAIGRAGVAFASTQGLAAGSEADLGLINAGDGVELFVIKDGANLDIDFATGSIRYLGNVLVHEDLSGAISVVDPFRVLNADATLNRFGTEQAISAPDEDGSLLVSFEDKSALEGSFDGDYNDVGLDLTFADGGPVVPPDPGEAVVEEGSAGDDVVRVDGSADVVNGLGGDDLYRVIRGDVVTILDTEGNDTIDGRDDVDGALIDLRAGAVSLINGVRVVIGGAGSVGLQAIDVVLAQDLTGSFADDVPTIQRTIPDLLARVEAVQPDNLFAVTSFRDFGDVFVFNIDQPLTDRLGRIQEVVDDFSANGGADFEEAQLVALEQIALRPNEIGFRDGAQKFVVLATDAPPHEAGDFPALPPNDLDGRIEDEDYPSLDQIRDLLADAGIDPIFLATDGVAGDYRDIVDTWGFGSVVELNVNSSNIVNALLRGLEGAAPETIENASGGPGDDTLIGNALDNGFNGRGGDDTITGLEGDDLLRGGEGADTFVFTENGGTDVLLDFDLAEGDALDTRALTETYGSESVFVSDREDLNGDGRRDDLRLLLDANGDGVEDRTVVILIRPGGIDDLLG